MTRTNIALLGFGNVGRAFVRLMNEKKPFLFRKYGLDLKLRAVLSAGGGVTAENEDVSLELDALGGERLAAHPRFRPGIRPADVLLRPEPGILVECISAHPETGEPALSYLKEAMARGWHVVTASKGPLAAEARGLRETARARSVAFRFSGATGAALPAADVGLMCLAGAEVESIQGILNGTTNFILTRMSEGLGYEEALSEARRLGIAEPDPGRDVAGRDSAVKLLILSNLLFDEGRGLGEVRVKGLEAVTASDVRHAAEQGKKVKLLARAERGAGRTVLRVEPEVLGFRHPLFGVDGAEKGVTFVTDSMGMVTVIGGKSDPRGAAAAMLKDVILLLRSGAA